MNDAPSLILERRTINIHYISPHACLSGNANIKTNISFRPHDVKQNLRGLSKKHLTRNAPDAIIIKRSRDARVVELADSLDSGSSVHSGRAGSSPASRTRLPRAPNEKDTFGCLFRFRSSKNLSFQLRHVAARPAIRMKKGAQAQLSTMGMKFSLGYSRTA